MDTDSIFEKSFAKYPFSSEKRAKGSTKAFRFRYIHLFSKKLMRFQHSVSSRAPVLCKMFFKEK